MDKGETALSRRNLRLAVGGATLAGDIIHTASHALHGSMPIILTASRDPRAPARMLAVFN